MQDKNEILAVRIRRVMQAMPPHSRKMPRRGLHVDRTHPFGWITFFVASESSKARNKPRLATLYRYPLPIGTQDALAADIVTKLDFDWKT